jgi:RNA polymerase sigma-70 factor (ECF subfamily)
MKISREEFMRLALEQMDAIDRVARSLTHNSAEADDLVQETYLAALKAHSCFELESFGIRPWLLRILHNLYVNHARRERRRPAALDAEQLEAVSDPAPPMPLDGTVVDEDVERALNGLPADLRTTLMLWAVDEMSYKQIAQVMDVPIGTVMSRLYRARQRLSEALGHSRGPTASRKME